MEATCAQCGQPLPLRLEALGLLVTRQPRAVYWRGLKLDLTPAQTMIMELLAERGGQASYGALNMVATDATSGDVIKVQICLLRRRLAAQGVGLRIVAERGEGYRLEAA